MTEKETLTKAAEALTQLDNERNQLLEKIAVHDKALEVTKNMFAYGRISSREIFSKYAELCAKTVHDLEVLEQAIELNKSAGFNFGKVSEIADPESVTNPEERFTTWLTEDN